LREGGVCQFINEITIEDNDLMYSNFKLKDYPNSFKCIIVMDEINSVCHKLFGRYAFAFVVISGHQEATQLQCIYMVKVFHFAAVSSGSLS